MQHALANAREALARKLADTSSQQKLLGALTETFSLPRTPRRIEVYDNSHIGGHQRSRRHGCRRIRKAFAKTSTASSIFDQPTSRLATTTG